MIVAKLNDVSLRLGRRWILTHLDFEVSAGKTVLLTGPNGAGKTTLLRLLATALRPTRGTMTLFGMKAQDHLEQVRPHVGLVTHASHLYEDLSAKENLQLVARLTNRPDVNIMQLLETVGLAEHAARTVRFFSAGMKRRLCIGRVLISRAELVLLDEPFSALDTQGVSLMEDIIADLRRDGKTLVICTHDHDRGRRVCDTHLQLDNGRQVQPLEALQ